MRWIWLKVASFEERVLRRFSANFARPPFLCETFEDTGPTPYGNWIFRTYLPMEHTALAVSFVLHNTQISKIAKRSELFYLDRLLSFINWRIHNESSAPCKDFLTIIGAQCCSLRLFHIFTQTRFLLPLSKSFFFLCNMYTLVNSLCKLKGGGGWTSWFAPKM